MNTRTLIFRSLRFRMRAHLGVVLGAMVGSAALVGALVVGDSVRETLRQKALERVGAAQFLLAAGDRFFSEVTWTNAFGESCAVTLHLPAVASAQSGATRANAVQVYGVTPDFWRFAPKAGPVAIAADSVLLNEALAAQLGVKAGDEVLFRLRKPSAMSRDTPLAPVSDLSAGRRLKVGAVLTSGQFGNFSRIASQAPPFNAFMRLDELQRAVGLANKANEVLVRTSSEHAESPATANRLLKVLREHWSLADAELELSLLTNRNEIALHSSRIFLEPAVVRAATNLHALSQADSAAATAPAASAQPVLTYLVNQFRAGTNSTPYSMITAAGPPWTPADLREDEIIINQWLAEDLQLRPGGTLELTYFQPESGAQLVETTNRFRVRSVAPLEGVHLDRTLMPEFPGISKAESTHDWDAGFQLVHEIRPKDEAYWKQYRGTPKAFVSSAGGEKTVGQPIRFAHRHPVSGAGRRRRRRISRRAGQSLAARAPAGGSRPAF